MAASFVNTDRSVTQAVLWLSSTEQLNYSGKSLGIFGAFGKTPNRA
jgi:hypothetical protein